MVNKAFRVLCCIPSYILWHVWAAVVRYERMMGVQRATKLMRSECKFISTLWKVPLVIINKTKDQNNAHIRSCT